MVIHDGVYNDEIRDFLKEKQPRGFRNGFRGYFRSCRQERTGLPDGSYICHL